MCGPGFLAQKNCTETGGLICPHTGKASFGRCNCKRLVVNLSTCSGSVCLDVPEVGIVKNILNRVTTTISFQCLKHFLKKNLQLCFNTPNIQCFGATPESCCTVNELQKSYLPIAIISSSNCDIQNFSFGEETSLENSSRFNVPSPEESTCWKSDFTFLA